MNEKNLEKMLRILVEQYEKDPPYYVPSSKLRASLDIPIEEIRPYAEGLVEEGYAYKCEGFSPTFIIRLNERGHKAFKKYAY